MFYIWTTKHVGRKKKGKVIACFNINQQHLWIKQCSQLISILYFTTKWVQLILSSHTWLLAFEMQNNQRRPRKPVLIAIWVHLNRTGCVSFQLFLRCPALTRQWPWHRGRLLYSLFHRCGRAQKLFLKGGGREGGSGDGEEDSAFFLWWTTRSEALLLPGALMCPQNGIKIAIWDWRQHVSFALRWSCVTIVEGTICMFLFLSILKWNFYWFYFVIWSHCVQLAPLAFFPIT